MAGGPTVSALLPFVASRVSASDDGARGPSGARAAETEAPALDLSRPGTPASAAFGDVYHSVDGGLREAREVFLGGCGLPDAWRGRERFTIAETGFGTGLNALAAWRAWRESGSRGRLRFVSIERYPFDRDALAALLAPFRDELGEETDALVGAWPGRVGGVHALELDGFALELWHMDVGAALAGMRLRADAWFLDGFAPSRNPEMWLPERLARVAELSAPGARLATFTVAGPVRRALADAGFAVERVPGFGRKRHRLEARLCASRPA